MPDRRPPATLILGALLAASLAGCAGGGADKSTGAGDSLSLVDLTPTQTTEARGAILGMVVDVEFVPVSRALVVILDLTAEAVTGNDGSFQFLNVPAGTHRIVAEKRGYTPQTVDVDVPAGGEVTVEVALEPVILIEPYHISLHNAAFIHFDVSITSAVVQQEDAEPWGAVCENCRWNIEWPEPPQDLLVEIYVIV